MMRLPSVIMVMLLNGCRLLPIARRGKAPDLTVLKN